MRATFLGASIGLPPSVGEWQVKDSGEEGKTRCIAAPLTQDQWIHPGGYYRVCPANVSAVGVGERYTLHHQPGTGATAVSASATGIDARNIRWKEGWQPCAKGCITICPKRPANALAAIFFFMLQPLNRRSNLPTPRLFSVNARQNSRLDDIIVRTTDTMPDDYGREFR
ncbi:hypothetical protein KM043_002732 [Ampulex compressa]|nr:hypothetical protein KM043_002732 [Ampulex compressa]